MRQICIIYVFLFISVASVAQKKELTASVFWKIEDPVTRNVSYLLGSYHPARADSFFNKFTEAGERLSGCKTFVCETLGFSDSVSTAKYLDAFKKLPKKTFKEWFGKDSALVDSFFIKNFPFLGISPSAAINKDSTLLGQCADLETLINLVNDSIYTMSGLHKRAFPIFDAVLSNYAKEAGKKILELDDPGFITDNILSRDYYTRDLTGYIRVFNKIIHKDASGLRKDDYYKTVGEMKQYYATATLNFKLKEKISNRSHIERNKAWLKKLIPEIERGEAFIVVGAYHLFMGGHYGLIPELKKRGFIATPVNLKPVN